MYKRSLPSFRISIFSERTYRYINRIGHQPRGCVNFRCLLCTDHKCCGNRNSKPSVSTNLKPTFIQLSIQCPREQCRHGECRFSQNEHILIKLVIRMCKISVLVAGLLHDLYSKPPFFANLMLLSIKQSAKGAKM